MVNYKKIFVDNDVVAYDGLAVVISPSNTFVDHLKLAELKNCQEGNVAMSHSNCRVLTPSLIMFPSSFTLESN